MNEHTANGHRRNAANLGCPVSIQLSEITSPLPQRTAGLDGEDVGQVDRLIQCIELLLITDDALRLRYGPRALEKKRGDEIMPILLFI